MRRLTADVACVLAVATTSATPAVAQERFRDEPTSDRRTTREAAAEVAQRGIVAARELGFWRRVNAALEDAVPQALDAAAWRGGGGAILEVLPQRDSKGNPSIVGGGARIIAAGPDASAALAHRFLRERAARAALRLGPSLGNTIRQDEARMLWVERRGTETIRIGPDPAAWHQIRLDALQSAADTSLDDVRLSAEAGQTYAAIAREGERRTADAVIRAEIGRLEAARARTDARLRELEVELQRALKKANRAARVQAWLDGIGTVVDAASLGVQVDEFLGEESPGLAGKPAAYVESEVNQIAIDTGLAAKRAEQSVDVVRKNLRRDIQALDQKLRNTGTPGVILP